MNWRIGLVGLVLFLSVNACKPAIAQPAPAAPASQPAADWLRRAQSELAGITDVREQGPAAWDVIRAWAASGDEKSATELADATVARPHRSYLEEVLACERARRGDFTGARKSAAGIEDEPARARALIEIVEALALAKDIKTATEVANEFVDTQWRVRAYAEIAGAQARNGDYAGAQATAEKTLEFFPPPPPPPNSRNLPTSMRDKILAVVAERQGLAGDLAGAHQTAQLIKDDMTRDLAENAIKDNEWEATFRKGWATLTSGPGSQRWPLPPADSLNAGVRGMLFEALSGAVTAKDQAAYDRAIAEAARITSFIVYEKPAPRPGVRRPRDPRADLLVKEDPTVMQRALAYTLIAVVEAARKDVPGAKAMIRRAIAIRG